MEPSTQKTPQVLIGERIRRARQERGLTQEALGGNEFTKGYVSALERGAVRPSLKALEVFSGRLEIPIADFLAAAQEPVTEPDIGAIQEDLHFQLNYANMLIHAGERDEALKLIDSVDEDTQPYWEQLTASSRYRLPFLRGMAYLQLNRIDDARAQLELAIRQADNDLDVTRVRNLIGISYYQQGQPQLALIEHEQCLQLVRTGPVKDLNLQLSVYRNVANDHLALNAPNLAVGIYKEALKVLQDMNDLQRQAGVYWGMAVAYRTAGDWGFAKLYATKALHIYEAEDNRIAAASMSLNMAEMLIHDNQYPDAEKMLARAKGFLSSVDDTALLSTLYRDSADLARRQGQLEQAAEYAKEGVRLGESAVAQPESTTQPEGHALRTYAEALHEAALVAEEQGQRDEADQFFRQALATIEPTSFDEALCTIAYSYAETLTARGAFEEAVAYYRMAVHTRGPEPH